MSVLFICDTLILVAQLKRHFSFLFTYYYWYIIPQLDVYSISGFQVPLIILIMLPGPTHPQCLMCAIFLKTLIICSAPTIKFFQIPKKSRKPMWRHVSHVEGCTHAPHTSPPILWCNPQACVRAASIRGYLSRMYQRVLDQSRVYKISGVLYLHNVLDISQLVKFTFEYIIECMIDLESSLTSRLNYVKGALFCIFVGFLIL